MFEGSGTGCNCSLRGPPAIGLMVRVEPAARVKVPTATESAVRLSGFMPSPTANAPVPAMLCMTAESELICSVPAFMYVAPEKLLAPSSVVMPVPVLIRLPG